MVTTSVAAHLRVVVARTARRLRQEAGTDLSPSQTSALAAVEHHGPLTPSELAGCERIQRPTATRVLARLEEAGLASRARAPRAAGGGGGGVRAPPIPPTGAGRWCRSRRRAASYSSGCARARTRSW